MKFKLVAAVAVVVGLSGCGVIKDAKEMKATMKELRDTGTHISKRTDDLEREMKFKESSGEFTRYTDRVFGENGQGVESGESHSTNPETEMLKDAESTVRALMFQFWKGDYNEGAVESLDKDAEISTLMFFTRIKKYVPESGDLNLSLRNAWIPDRGYKGLASLAARLEQMQDSYSKALAVKGLPANLSFYEMIMEALRNRDAVVQGGLLPKTKSRILQWKKEAVFTIQLRHNYLPMMVLSRVSDFADRGDFRRGWMAFVRDSRFNINDPDPSKSISNALLQETTVWLNNALETRARLRAIGIEPKYNHMFGKILKSVNFNQDKILARQYPTSGDAGRDKLIYDFAAAYQKVVSEMPSNVLFPARAAVVPQQTAPVVDENPAPAAPVESQVPTSP